jgi:sulfoxide reductase catalytic subunit YedY
MERTPESVYLNRRALLKGLGFLGASALLGEAALAAAASGKVKMKAADAASAAGFTPDASLKPKITPRKLAAHYNNFYEFSLEKGEVAEKVEDWQLAPPWKVKIGGLAEHAREWTVEELVAKLGTEERVYRFRCVEAWSMVLPWTGFPLAKLIELAKPKKEAKYVRFETFSSDRVPAPGFKSLGYYPWPYVEGLTLEEARHPLALIATGLYGQPLPKQNGAPIRLVVPWKYGFKNIKSIVKIEFTRERPVGLWEKLAPEEYGFYANVNPDVPHPRWSQASERVIDGSFFPKRQPTLPFNGYAKEVAGLYRGLDLKKNY